MCKSVLLTAVFLVCSTTVLFAVEMRAERLKTLSEKYPQIVFTEHFDLGGSHYAYTEAQSDAQSERNFVAGSALGLLEFKNGDYIERTLINDPNGVIRDPAVSFDGETVVFAWKKSDRLDDYHLYDYDVASGEVRQVDFGREVKTDQVAITIRADFSHDTYWKECVIECSNGFKQKITFRKTAERHVFIIPVQRTQWVKLTGFVIDTPGWAALSEVEVFGIR